MDYLQNVMGYFDQQQPLCAQHDKISKDLYQEYGVKAGLRDENGKGVLAGLTNISDIRAFQYVDGVKKPADGQLLYRGYDVKDLIRGSSGSRFAFEEAGYLLLFGELPTPEKLEEFCRVLGECRTMPTNFTRDVIMKAPSHDIMNSMARSVLTLASYDPKAGDLEISNVLRQSIQLAGIFPMLAVYSYHAYNHKDSDGDCQLYTYLPDAEKEYEHVSIVCVWTVKLPVTGKSTNIKFVHIYWAGKIEPTRDEHNMHLTNMDISTICGYGDAVFEKDNNWLLENIMAADSVFVLYPEDDSIRPIKASDNDDIYGFIAQQALAHFSIRDLLQTMVSDSNQFPVEVTVEKEVIMPGYFSSSWWRGKQRYEFKLLSQNNK